MYFLKIIMHDVLAAEKASPCAAFELGLERMLSNAPSRVSESKYATPILVHRHKSSQQFSPLLLLASRHVLMNILRASSPNIQPIA